MTENERFKLIRETLQMSQQEMAEALGVTQVAVSNAETGKISTTGKPLRVSVNIRNTLAKKYGINKAWLEDGVGTMFTKPPKKFDNDKDHIIALLEDKVRLLQVQIKDKDRIIALLSDKSRTNRTKKG